MNKLAKLGLLASTSYVIWSYGALAQQIPSFPNASVPFSGGEQTYLVQGGASKNMTLNQLATWTGPTTPNTNSLRLACTSATSCPSGDPVYASGVVRLTDGVAGAGPQYFGVDNAGLCSVDDVGKCVASANSGFWYAPASASGMANALQFSAANNGLTDATSALNTALADTTGLYVPPGNYLISDELKCPQNHSFLGAGPSVTTFLVSSSFNLSAHGVIQMGTVGGQACTVDGMSVSFSQPNVPGMTLANIVQYPEAFDGDGIHAANGATWGTGLGLQATNAWVCLSTIPSGTGVPGGIVIGRIQCSSYNTGLRIQAPNAFMDLQSWDQETADLTANQVPVYENCGFTNACCAMVGLGLTPATHVSFMGAFAQPVYLTGAGSGTGFPANPSITFDTLELDSDGAELIKPDRTDNLVVQIGSLYSTKGVAVSATPTISIAGPATIVTISNAFMRDGQTVPLIDVLTADTAYLEIDGGIYYTTSSQAITGFMASGSSHIYLNNMIINSPNQQPLLAWANGGQVFVRQSHLFNPTPVTIEYLASGTGSALVMQGNLVSTANVVPNAPMIQQSNSASLALVGNIFTGASGPATGQTILSVGADLAANYISDNKFQGWGISFPSVGAAGYYDINDYAFPLTVTTTFTTSGNYSEGTTTTSGTYMRLGDYVDLTASKTFNPTYTTASGSFQATTNAPHPITVLPAPCALSTLNNFTLATGTIPTFSLNSSATIAPQLIQSGASMANFTTTNVPCGTANMNFTIACHYKVR